MFPRTSIKVLFLFKIQFRVLYCIFFWFNFKRPTPWNVCWLSCCVLWSTTVSVILHFMTFPVWYFLSSHIKPYRTIVIEVSGGIGKGWPMRAKLQLQWGEENLKLFMEPWLYTAILPSTHKARKDFESFCPKRNIKRCICLRRHA